MWTRNDNRFRSIPRLRRRHRRSPVRRRGHRHAPRETRPSCARRSTGVTTGAIRSRPTRSCEPAFFNCLAGAFWTESKRQARRGPIDVVSLWRRGRGRCRSNRRTALRVSTRPGVPSLTGCLSTPRDRAGAEIEFETQLVDLVRADNGRVLRRTPQGCVMSRSAKSLLNS